MPDDTQLIPAREAGQIGNLAVQFGGTGLPPSLQILLNDNLYNRVKQLSGVMAKAEGFTPRHLIGKPEACFTVITIALDSRLSPNFVAKNTYQTPGGQIGYQGALVQAILEQSGRFVGPPNFEYVGDWAKLRGKFAKKTSSKGNEFVVPTWTPDDAIGLGIIVRWRVKEEEKPRIWPETEPFWLTQCYPLNSPLWATDPKSQIAYLAIRRFANFTSPGILGAAASNEAELLDASETAIDITPQPEPRRADFDEEIPARNPQRSYDVVDIDGEVHVFSDADKAIAALRLVLSDAARRDVEVLDEIWGHNSTVIDDIDPQMRAELATDYADLRERVLETAKRGAAEQRISTESETPERGEANDPETKSGDAAGAEDDGSPAHHQNLPLQPAAPDAAPQGPGPAAAGTPPVAAAPARDGHTRASQLITVPTRGGRGELDYRAWAVALFLPKLRRQIDANALAYLLGDNEQSLEACRNGGLAKDELNGLEADIKAAWERCK